MLDELRSASDGTFEERDQASAEGKRLDEVSDEVPDEVPDEMPDGVPDEMPDDLPVGLKRDLAEAQACLDAGAPNAAAMMCRRVLSRIAIYNGADRSLTTGPQLQHLLDRNIIGDNVFHAARKVKALGDEGAHPPERVSMDEAREVFNLVEQIAQAVPSPETPEENQP